MTCKQLKALKRRKSIQHRINVKRNNIPRGRFESAVWIARYGAEYGIDRID